MAKDKKKKKKSEDEEDEIDLDDVEEEADEKKEKKKKKKKSKDKDEEPEEKGDDEEEDEEGRKSRKDKKKKKKKKKEKDSDEEAEDDGEEKDDLSIDIAGVTNDEEGEANGEAEESDEKEKGKSAFEKSELFVLVTSDKEFNRETPKKVKKLIEDGASVTLRGEFNETYLHALMGPKPEGTDSAVLAVLYQLVEAGLDVNSRDTEGFTPLHIAVLNDLNPRIVNALNKVGADPCALNNQDQDAMDLCELDGIKDVLDYYDMGLWRLVAAAEAGKVRALVNSWCKVDLVNEAGKKLDDLADEVGNEFISEILKEFKIKNEVIMAALSGNMPRLEKATKKDGVDLNVKDWSYTRPSDGKRTHRPLLAECVSLGWFECARTLVKRGADVNYEVEVIEGRKEPLYLYLFYLMAPQKNLDVELFKQVLKKADFSLVSDHYTLAYQCWQMNVPGDLFAQMVESGLKIETRDGDGYTVRDRILIENFEVGIKGDREKLREALFYVDESVIKMATSGQLEQLEKLAQEGYDYIDVADLKGKPIKKLAKKEDEKDVVKFLDKLPEFQKKNAAVQNGIIKGNLMEVRDNLNKKLSKTRDRNGRVPLLQAVLLERRFIIKYILKEFPKTINATDFHGRTALHYACAIAQGGDIEDALIDAGADAEVEDMEGKKPDEYQVRMGMNFIINERNKELGADTFLLDRYIAMLYAIEDGEEDRLVGILESLPVHYGLKDFDRLLPSRFPKLDYRPLVLVAVDNDQEQMAIRLIDTGASYHVAGKFKDMDANRTTMSLEEAAERKDMQELLEHIQQLRATEGENKKAEMALKDMLRRDSVAFSQTEYQRGSTPDSLKSGSLPGIGEEEEYVPRSKKKTNNAPPARATPNQPQSPSQDPQQSSTCTIL